MINNELIWAIVPFITYTIDYSLIRMMIESQSEKRRSNKAINIFFLFNILISSAIYIYGIEANINLMIYFILILTFCKFNYKETTIKILLIMGMFALLVSTVDIATSSLLMKMNNTSSIEILLSNSILRLQGIFLSKTVLIIIIFMYSKVKFVMKLSKKEFLFLSVPIFTNILSTLFIYDYIFKYLEYINVPNLYMVILPFVLMISNMSIIYILIKNIRQKEIEVENNLIKEKINLQYEHYSKMKDNNETIRELYHDMKNHVMCIEALEIQNKEAREYLNRINDKLDEYKSSYFETGNMILDVILSEKYTTCKKKKIKFSADINFNNSEFMDVVDVCIIFSNLIDNSIEACEKVSGNKDKSINVKGTFVNGFFILKIVNTKSGEVTIENNKIQTSKKDNSKHGIGLSSVERSVNKYEGEIVYDYTQEEFKVNIMLPIKSQKMTSCD